MALTTAIREIVKQVDDSMKVMPLIVKIMGNPEWLSDAYLAAQFIPHQVNFGWFLQGFNVVKPLVEFVADDIVGPSIPSYRTRGRLSGNVRGIIWARLICKADLADHLKVNLLDPQCRFLIYGSILDDRTQQLLIQNRPALQNDRLIL